MVSALIARRLALLGERVISGLSWQAAQNWA
jgi:hypothetical protein